MSGSRTYACLFGSPGTSRFSAPEIAEVVIMFAHVASGGRLRVDEHAAEAYQWGRTPPYV
jgi:hypothetical protein